MSGIGLNRVKALGQAAAVVAVAVSGAFWLGIVVRVFTWAAGF